MITEVSPVLHKAQTLLKADELLLHKGSWVKFSDAWTTDQFEWASGKLFFVNNEPLLVRYPISRIIPGNDYIDLDLSNQTIPTATNPGTQQLYPANGKVLYQMAVGMKKGNYFIDTYIPAQKPVYALPSTYLTAPVYTDSRRYLGAKVPKDSPASAPLWFFYSIMNMTPIVLRVFMDVGVNFDKAVLEFNINKCKLTLIPAPAPTAPKTAAAAYDDMVSKALLIPAYDELVGY